MKNNFIIVFCLFVTCSSAKAQLNIELLGQFDYDEILSSIWGWSDGLGNEYALVGTYDGVSIVNITDPTAPEELQFIACEPSTIREISSFSNYAYVAGGYTDGLLCINLSTLPDSANYVFRNLGIGFHYAHTLFCDENGIIHTFGGNLAGDVMFDATVSPMNPEYVATISTDYIHDGFVRGDTLWAANIYNGVFTVWDIADKFAPVLLATQETPNTFTHNVDVTIDGKYLFSTDEISGACVAAYDVSDLSDIKEIDRFFADEGDYSIPHNTVIKDNFLITAWYTNGVIITDITHPDNMIKTGWYDTSPYEGDGFYGSWRVMPFLPSGIMITSDRQDGLFILQPTYVLACYLKGIVTDAVTGAPIFDADITIELSPDAATATSI
ncbi:MAG: choice-of-anchor B family protein, partial [Chitinophagales bacterium]|nr:choice-of-anchor B family protein [Chitinophagales bacterium]